MLLTKYLQNRVSRSGRVVEVGGLRVAPYGAEIDEGFSTVERIAKKLAGFATVGPRVAGYFPSANEKKSPSIGLTG